MCSQRTPREEAIVDGLRKAGVPSRYFNVGLEAMPDRWAYITGITGSGKTHLACGMVRDYVETHMDCYEVPDFHGNVVDRIYLPPRAKFITARDYLATVKAEYDGNADSRYYRLTPFLVIDDLGQETPTQWAVGELYELINYRYGEDLPTIITSQFRRDQIARRLSQNGGEEQALAIASRLAEMCDVIDLGVRDRRIAWASS